MKSIAIQQTLHGYSEGHRLLDGSVKLTDDLARLVLRMSDLSGSNVVSGFEEYLTGYPLEAMNLYALAKTWYASEMPRPGCVWTHTLFIPGSSMADIPDLQALNALFVRPQSAKAFTGYSKPIQFEVKPTYVGNFSSDNGAAIQVADLIETLYQQNKENVLIGTQNSRSYETALFRVWSQQWPQLRKNFTFCTGALSARGFNGKPFDLQCTANSLIREITAASAAKQSREMSLLIKSDQQQPAWFVRATDDALNPVGETFRRLLWEFADTPNRIFYVRYALLIEKFLNSSERSIEEMVAMVVEQFPTEDAGQNLKSAFFGTGREIPGFKPFDEGDVLAALASTPHHLAFNSEALQLKRRGHDLCNVNPQSARQTIAKLFRSPVNPLGEDILAGMIEAINPAIAREVTSENPQFLPMLFRAKPELGVSSELWVAAGDHKRELFESLISHEKIEDSIIARVVQALLESDSEFLLRRALDKWGKPAVYGVFEWLSKSDCILSERSMGALTFHIESVVDWVLADNDRTQKAVIAAAHIVAPYSYKISEFKTDVWLHTFRTLQKEDQQKEATYFATFLLSLGLQNAPPDPITLIAECFSYVHQVAWDDKLPDDSWIILDPVVPHLWWLHDWDKCERMRRGLVETFVRQKWSLLQLAQCISNEELLSQILITARKVDGGSELTSQKH